MLSFGAIEKGDKWCRNDQLIPTYTKWSTFRLYSYAFSNNHTSYSERAQEADTCPIIWVFMRLAKSILGITIDANILHLATKWTDAQYRSGWYLFFGPIKHGDMHWRNLASVHSKLKMQS